MITKTTAAPAKKQLWPDSVGLQTVKDNQTWPCDALSLEKRHKRLVCMLLRQWQQKQKEEEKEEKRQQQMEHAHTHRVSLLCAYVC